MGDTDKKESLKREMHRTAQDLYQKFDRIEGSLQDTFEEGRKTVSRAVQTVTEAAHTFSPVYQIRKNPLAWTGGAVAGGFVAGHLALGPRSAGTRSEKVIQAPPSSGRGRSLLRAFTMEFAPELRGLREFLMISAAKYAADKLRAQKPEYQDQISQLEATLKSHFSRV